jgi:predicted branched-subunit amino acid permease
MLMSLSLSQKIEQKITLKQRLLIGFGITDETFSVASLETGKLSFSFLLGLITGPFLGWSIGTLAGALICAALPSSLSSAMGIALYGMFIAIIIPPAKKSKPVTFIISLSVLIVCIFRYIPVLNQVSSGFRVIIATFLSAGTGAILFPENDEKEEEENQ